MKHFTILSGISFIILCSLTTGYTGIKSDTAGVFPSVIDLGNNPDGVITITAPSESQTWFKTATVTDLNKDGYDDIIAYGSLANVPGVGSTSMLYIMYGGQALPSRINLDNPPYGIASIELDNFRSVLDLQSGDFNNDGIADLFFVNMVPESGPFQGQGYKYILTVIPGRIDLRGRTTISDNAPGLTTIYARIEPVTSIGQMSIFYIKDINGDNKDDVIISYPSKQKNNINSIGKMYILWGGQQMPSEINLESTSLKVTTIEGDTLYRNGTSAGGYYTDYDVPGGMGAAGGSFSNFAFGDIDNDYKMDIVFNGGTNRTYDLMPAGYKDPSIRQGISYLVYGSVLLNPLYRDQPLGLGEKMIGLTTFTRHTAAAIGGTQDETMFDLYNKVGVGDINGDGADDVFIGYPFKPVIGANDYDGKGKIFLEYGSRNYLFSGDIDRINSGAMKIEGARNGTHIGLSFNFADFNGDGFQDALIAADNAFYIMLGRSAFPDSMLLTEEFPLVTKVTGGTFIGTGDVNGDGYADIIGNKPDQTIYVILGRGKTYTTGSTVVRELNQSTKSKYIFTYSDSSRFHFSFTSGRASSNTELQIVNHGNHLPDSLQSIPTSQNVVSFIQADLINMPSMFTYRVQCSIDFTDSALSASGIRKQDLIVSTYNEEKAKWEKLETNIDTTINRATFEVEHLSLFALTDKNDSVLTGIQEAPAQIPLTFELSQNYPNPFNPVTTIKCQIPKASRVTLRIYNILGQEVKTVISEKLSAGTHEVQWNGTNNFGQKVSSGIYIYRMETNSGYMQTKKMVYLK